MAGRPAHEIVDEFVTAVAHLILTRQNGHEEVIILTLVAQSRHITVCPHEIDIASLGAVRHTTQFSCVATAAAMWFAA